MPTSPASTKMDIDTDERMYDVEESGSESADSASIPEDNVVGHTSRSAGVVRTSRSSYSNEVDSLPSDVRHANNVADFYNGFFGLSQLPPVRWPSGRVLGSPTQTEATDFLTFSPYEQMVSLIVVARVVSMSFTDQLASLVYSMPSRIYPMECLSILSDNKHFAPTVIYLTILLEGKIR
ncbi:hypothetical protein BV25DRAFT_1913064 [Artomyces pyxidatus]|uniref:Uncharacterized protein n=1 Tax=Artomyces pyxidatus TaxID=48021 RepID=A0ACB8TDB1_9AGAM|nr:hypothetical protein BV25DRAFT_1913064 [Artomyces pyxidatus]